MTTPSIHKAATTTFQLPSHSFFSMGRSMTSPRHRRYTFSVHDASIQHGNYSAAHSCVLFRVSDHQYGHPGSIQVAEDLHDLLVMSTVQITCRLISENQRRVINQRAQAPRVAAGRRTVAEGNAWLDAPSPSFQALGRPAPPVLSLPPHHKSRGVPHWSKR